MEDLFWSIFLYRVKIYYVSGKEYVKYCASDSFAVARKLLGRFFPLIIRTTIKILLYISSLKFNQN